MGPVWALDGTTWTQCGHAGSVSKIVTVNRNCSLTSVTDVLDLDSKIVTVD